MIDVEPYFPDMKFTPDDYQVEGTFEMVNKPVFFIGDKPGSGKSKQAIDAACILYDHGIIDTVVVVCPAQVKISWYDYDFGEIVKHAFVRSLITEFSSKRPMIPWSTDELVWAVMSYECGRMDLYSKLLDNELKDRKVMFIFDESIRVANWQSLQHKVFKKLVFQRADRVVELNGTPGDPVDMYGQFEVMDPRIIGCKNFYHFRARYCIMVPIKKGSPILKILEFTNRDLLDARIKPYILRREPPVGVRRIDQVVNVALTPATWKIYKQMRDSLIASLADKQATASNAMVKGIRLAQITSGLLGGIEAAPLDLFDGVEPELLGSAYPVSPDDSKVVELSTEKIDGLLEWIKYRTLDFPNLRVLIWCRFRPEIRRVTRALRAAGYDVSNIIGGQKRPEREAAVREFTVGDSTKPHIVVGQQEAGGMGLNFITCHYTIYCSNVFSYRSREQTELRTMRKGQMFDCTFVDMIATGPDGQKTIDHHIVKSLREQESVARWTMEDWRRRLLDE
jgi:hypothetical protein